MDTETPETDKDNDSSKVEVQRFTEAYQSLPLKDMKKVLNKLNLIYQKLLIKNLKESFKKGK